MQLEVGSIVEGKVTGITKFGAFVDVGDGKTGMAHISEVAPTYVKEISDYLTDGQQVKVKILSISEDGKISLSIKRAMENQSAPQPNFQNRGNDRRPPRRDFKRGPKNGGEEPNSFEDMLNKFKQNSDDRMSDLKKSSDGRRSRKSGHKG